MSEYCGNCKHCRVIISQMADYWCAKKDLYFHCDTLTQNCSDFEKDTVTLEEKEDKVW